ncbi:MAG: acyltransferase [Verrucomicrobiota bacterium]
MPHDLPPARLHRLEVLDSLRGLAALWVGIYHFTQNGATMHGYPADSALKSAGTYGYLAVFVFFVISGFIIPWALQRGSYHLSEYGRFLLKRLLRLHPLYLLSAVCMIAPYFFGQAHTMASVGWSNWWPHFFYLNDLLHRPWLMDIYWTLALDFQYCLIAGLILPLLIHHRAWIRLVCLAAFVSLSLIFPEDRWVTHYTAYFAMGTATFWWFRRLVNLPGFLMILAVCYAVAVKAQWHPHALMGLGTALSIAFVPLRHPALSWLGSISYPFYLFHLVIGGPVNTFLAQRPRDPWVDTAGVCLALAVSAAGAWALHRWVETPSQRWSSAVRFRNH